MNLAPSIFQQLTGVGNVRFEAFDRDKRDTGRVQFSAAVCIAPIQDGHICKPLRARTRDISPTGLGLLCPHPIQPGQSFLIQLPRKKGQPLWLICHAVRCKTATGGLFVIGARFSSFLRQMDALSTGPEDLTVFERAETTY